MNSNMVQHYVRVQHGNKLVATVRVAVPYSLGEQEARRRAVIIAEQNARVFHNIPPQVQLHGIVASNGFQAVTRSAGDSLGVVR